MFTIGVGAALAVLSCIGLVSAITRGKSGAVVYSLLLLLLIGSQIYILWQAGRLERRVLRFLSRKWDDMQEQERYSVQKWRHCCGFEGADDRAVVPCPDDAYSGCASSIHEILRDWTGGMRTGLSIAIIIELVFIALSLIVSFSRAKY